MIYSLNTAEELTEKIICEIVRQHYQCELPRLNKLKDYYEGKNEITHRVMKDPTKPNNKVSNPYASYITDTLTGYFIGEPITYNSQDEDVLNELNMIFEYNDEADENTELAKNASIYGVAYEYLYVQDNMIRFKIFDTREIIAIYDKTVEHNLIAVLRCYDDYDWVEGKNISIVEVITDKEVIRYKTNDVKSSLTLLVSYPHYFGMVPVAVYYNNEEALGDFERVIPLIDAYDCMESDTLNDFEYFTDCYLCLYGFTAEKEDIIQMKENRVLLMDEGTNAEWLTKDINDTYTENMKNRLDNDIHKFAKCPNMSDEAFASNASGIAIKFKTMGTENLVSIKERKFKRGLQMRLELIANVKGLMADGFDWRAIEMNFTRNIPTNLIDIADVVNKLSGIVSDETLLAQVPFVEDVQTEIERLDKEKEKNPLLQSALSYNTTAMMREQEEEKED